MRSSNSGNPGLLLYLAGSQADESAQEVAADLAEKL